MLGHKSLRTMTSRKTKEEVQAELEQKHKKLTEEKSTMIEMFSILEILLATKSIPLFKVFILLCSPSKGIITKLFCKNGFPLLPKQHHKSRLCGSSSQKKARNISRLDCWEIVSF